MLSRNDMSDTVTKFYAGLTPFYHLIYPDWNKSIERQASMLDAIVRERWGDAVNTVLDVACGIGTQCLGLAWGIRLRPPTCHQKRWNVQIEKQRQESWPYPSRWPTCEQHSINMPLSSMLLPVTMQCPISSFSLHK